MKWLLSLWAPIRPHLFGVVGVIAVAGLISCAAAYAYIRKQAQVIDQQTKVVEAREQQIAGLAAAVTAQVTLRQLEQENTRLLQDKIALIEERSSDMSSQLKQLEATNAEVREFMARRIPDDLRRVLDQQ